MWKKSTRQERPSQFTASELASRLVNKGSETLIDVSPSAQAMATTAPRTREQHEHTHQHADYKTRVTSDYVYLGQDPSTMGVNTTATWVTVNGRWRVS